MKRSKKSGFKRVCAVMLSLAMGVTMLPVNATAAMSSDNGNKTFDNPVIYADVPDIDILRMGDTYYMVSTTMHLSPGCPIMKSTDLVNWEIVNYVYDRLDESDVACLRNGKSMYGNGQWASSLQYHDGKYYVAFNSNTTGTAYIFTTDDIEKGSWTRTSLNGAYHDMALFFDDDSAYIVYGGGDIKYAELNEDLSGVKPDGKKGTLFSGNKNNGTDLFPNGYILTGEGTHVLKKDGYYYVFTISWPNGNPRTEICHRSKNFPGTESDWETKVILNSNFTNNGVTAGVAQGGVIDTVDGKWYGYLFQDHGAIGRVPVLTDCTWKDGWPMLGKNGDGKTVENTMPLPVDGSDLKTIVKSDEFYNDAEHRVFEADETTETNVQALQVVENDTKTVKEGEAEVPEIVEVIKNGSFDEGIEGFEGFENGKIAAATENGEKCVQVKERTAPGSGVMQNVTGSLKKGQEYTVKFDVMYKDGPATKKFNITLQHGPDYRYRTIIGTVEATKGEWKHAKFTYTAADKSAEAPFETSKNLIFVETPWTAKPDPEDDLMDFWVDNVSMTYEKSAEAENPEDTEDKAKLIELFTNGDFETGDTTGWQIMRTEKGEIEAVSENALNGSYSGHVFNRQSCGAGACQNISGKLVPGKEYKISGKLKYTSGPATKQFNVTIENGDDYRWREDFIHFTAKKGEWTSFEGTYEVHDKSDTYPFDSTQNYIFIETPWTASPTAENDWMEYWIDDLSMTTESDEIIENGSFDEGIDGWYGFEDGQVEPSTEAQAGAGSIKAVNRKATANGPAQNLSNLLKAGYKYTLTAYIKYDAGVATKTFNATIQNGPDYRYRTVLGSATATKGEWTKIETTFTMPEDAILTQNYLFFETPWVQSPTKENDLMDFYVDSVTLTEQPMDEKVVAEAGEADYNGSDLDLVWQWNHNPNNNKWSLTKRSGWLRLETSKAKGLLDARNTLTQRTYGPTCSGKIKMDITNMKAGDVAGLGSLSYNYGYIAVKKEASGAKLVMVDATANDKNKADEPKEIAFADVTGNIVYLKEDFDFAGGDKVSFFYSFDGANWTKLGETIHPTYELTHFMGSKFAIFNYATKALGGYVDVDYFRVSDELTGDNKVESTLKADVSDAKVISGVINSECEVTITMDKLAKANYKNLKASFAIPEIMDVVDVAFNEKAIQGNASFTAKNGRLLIEVAGDDVSFDAEDKVFATIKLKCNDYVSGDTTESVKADYITVDETVDYDVTDCEGTITLKYLDTGAVAKKLGYSNPIVTQEFGADPYAIVYNDRVYVYMTADDYQYDEAGNVKNNDFGYIKTLRVASSDDMVNWTDHGAINVAGEDGAAKWAAHSWAPAIAYKQIDGVDKFFLYFANDASGIGVLEGETPLGPWKDPIGKALITGATPGCKGVVWCFDPAVLVDDDGSAYIYFGGGVPTGQQDNPKTARVAKLGDDMISIDGEAKLIDAPCMFEDSGIFKYNGTYYYSYCSNFISPHAEGYPGYGTICYMTSDNPMGPFTYQGEIFSNPSVWFGVGGNNHHATFVFNDRTYFIYHAQTVSKEYGIEKGYRSTHIDDINFNSNGTIKSISGTYKGIKQLKNVNPYETIEAETIAWNKGIKTEANEEKGLLFEAFNRSLVNVDQGDWTSVAGADFGENGAKTFTVKAASKNGGKIEIRLDSPEGALIGTVSVAATEAYKEFSCDVDNVKGVRNVFLVFNGVDKKDIMQVDSYKFTEKESTQKPGDKPEKPAPEKPTNPTTPTTPVKDLTQYVNKQVDGNNVSYKVLQCTDKEKTVTITKVTNTKAKTIVIPATVTYDGMTFKVTAIADNAFKNNKKITKVVIGSEIQTIGKKAFYGCKNLKKITIKGKNVKKIGSSAFAKIKKNATFDVANSKIKYFKKLLKKAKTKDYKVK